MIFCNLGKPKNLGRTYELQAKPNNRFYIEVLFYEHIKYDDKYVHPKEIKTSYNQLLSETNTKR